MFTLFSKFGVPSPSKSYVNFVWYVIVYVSVISPKSITNPSPSSLGVIVAPLASGSISIEPSTNFCPEPAKSSVKTNPRKSCLSALMVIVQSIVLFS